jgi:predicted molibdopterin-dependent oxidoreductase YjgC
MSSSSGTTLTTVTIHADGRALRVPAGVSVAAALLDAGVTAFRRSAGGDARGPLCGMGTCFECRVTIDGVAHRRACLVPVADGMRVSTAASPPASQS